MRKAGKWISVLLLALAVATGFVLVACSPGEGETPGGTLTDYEVEGGVYTGTSTDGTATGTGTITYTNGNIYEGPVVSGKPQGDGIMIDVVSEGTYTGGFADGVYSDTDAMMEFDNGGKYTGVFEGGKMKGAGEFVWPDGTVFMGTFSGEGGKAGSCGGINGTGVMAFVGGIDFTGTVNTGFPEEGAFTWPGDGPIFTGMFTAFLTGYGDLDMRNGVHYYGPMGAGLLVPTDAWTETGKKVKITYPENTDYNGEMFEGDYVHNDAINKDELVGTITRKDNSKLTNVKIALDFSFSYRYEGEFVSDGVTYTGSLRDGNIPYGAGVYQWPDNGPAFTVSEGHGFLTGAGVLDMKNGITYTGPLNAVAMAAKGGTEFQPYLKFDGTLADTVKIVHPTGTFEGKLTAFDSKNLSASVAVFYGNATYVSEGVFTDANGNKLDFLFIPTFAMGLYPILETDGTPVTVADLPYEGRYLNVGGALIAYGKGITYWTAVDGAPRIESDFFYNNMTGVVKFVQAGYTYEGGMTLMAFGAECGVKAAKVTFENGDVFEGEWASGALTGTITYAAGGTAAGTVAITLITCAFTASAA